jgi:hypothetical protein
MDVFSWIFGWQIELWSPLRRYFDRLRNQTHNNPVAIQSPGCYALNIVTISFTCAYVEPIYTGSYLDYLAHLVIHFCIRSLEHNRNQCAKTPLA